MLLEFIEEANTLHKSHQIVYETVLTKNLSHGPAMKQGSPPLSIEAWAFDQNMPHRKAYMAGVTHRGLSPLSSLHQVAMSCVCMANP